MTERTYHDAEAVFADNLHWNLKSGDSIRMWRQSTFHLHYMNSTTGLPYLSVQDLGWASYNLTPFPSCTSLVVSHNSHITPDKRGKGLGNFFHDERVAICKAADRSCMICTVDKSNTIERHILETHSWKKVHEFLNKDTNNTVEIWVKNL